MSEDKYFTTSDGIEFIRTVTPSDNSSFFHALYTALKEYRQLNKDEKRLYVEKKREYFSEKLQLEQWFSIQKGNVAFLQILEMMRIVIYMIPNILEDPDPKPDIFKLYHIDRELLRLLFSLLDSKTVDEYLLPQWDIECMEMEERSIQKDIMLHRMKNKWYEIYREHLTKTIETLETEISPLQEKMDNGKKSKVIHKLAEISYGIFDWVIDKAFSDFRNDIRDYNVWINIFYISSILCYMDHQFNILLIDETTGLPFEGQRFMEPFCNNSFCNRPFIVLLYFPDYHFESLGRIQNNSVNRIFGIDDPFITKSLDYLKK